MGVSRPPRPSPGHHTPSAHAAEHASAILTVGRQAIPRASGNWTVPNTALAATGCCPVRCATQVTGPAITAGFPRAAEPSMRAKPVLNMKGWNCSTASRSQSAARLSWSQRRRSRAVRGRDGDPVTGPGRKLLALGWVRTPTRVTSMIANGWTAGGS